MANENKIANHGDIRILTGSGGLPNRPQAIGQSPYKLMCWAIASSP